MVGWDTSTHLVLPEPAHYVGLKSRKGVISFNLCSEYRPEATPSFNLVLPIRLA
jgi:hypothetical protein